MAVYTHLSLTELDIFLGDYNIGSVMSFEGIAEGVENSNFFLKTDQGCFILTLYEKRVNPADLPFFIGLLDHLAARGIKCPMPVRGRDGEALRTIVGKPASIVTFLEGICVNTPQPSHCRELGRNLAALHLAGQDYEGRRENTLGLKGWRPLFEQCRTRTNEVEQELTDLVLDELDFLDIEWPGDLCQGLIHADLFTDNVFFRKNYISGLIDFYFACNDALSYDLAICINAWCFETDGSFNTTKARAITEGYNAVRPLENREKTSLPILCRGAALRFLLTRLHDWLYPVDGALVKPKDPLIFAHRLRFHQKVGSPESLGLD